MTVQATICPVCGGPMIRRTSAHGAFWGCRSFPRCRGTRDVNGESHDERRAKAETPREPDDHEKAFNPIRGLFDRREPD